MVTKTVALALLAAVAGAMQVEQEDISCYKYTCNNDQIPMLNSTCATYFNGTFYLQTCGDKDAPFCTPDVTPGGNSTCQMGPPPPVGFAWPGENCTTQADCAEGTCTNNVCVGVAANGHCVTNGQCNPGLYCGNNLCTKQVPVNGTCAYDYQCVNNAGCNVLEGNKTGTCTPYLTVDYYQPVGPCIQNATYLCGSGTCMFNASGSYCVPEPESYAQPPLKCINDGDCFSVPDPVMKGVLTSHCNCSYNPWGMSFCELFPGDEIGVTVRKYLYTWFQGSGSLNCNTIRRMSLNCISQNYNYEDYLWLAYHMTWYSDFSLVQFLDPCGQLIYQQDYWSIKYAFNHYRSNFTDTDDYSASAALALSALIALY